ncbi:hypothetical protein Scep_004204 [Stephania cephalantha]|uniref:Uncharacterized protein n=1 Tax=Stephania cephalantha TaxID=152367 RepID=A0AAP0PWG3_9MAGN
MMKIERLIEKIEKKEDKEMKKEVEVKEQVEVAVEVEVEVEMQVEVKMASLKKKRKEVQVGEMIKKMKVKWEKIPKKKWWNKSLVLRPVGRLSRDHQIKWRPTKVPNLFLVGQLIRSYCRASTIMSPPSYEITRSEAMELVSSALDVSEKEVEQQRVRHSVDVVKAWKVLPPRESDKAFAIKMADDALKLLTMFGSPTPSQPKSKPAEGVSSSKHKATPLGASPSIQKGKKTRK